MNKIDELSLAHLGVEDGLYLVLLFSIDNERGKRSWGSTRDGIRTILLQKADMEDRMDLHGLGQVEAVRSSTDLLEDLERADSLVVKLTGRTVGAEIAGIEPDLVANLEVGLGHGLGIKVAGVAIDG